jgi:hypothetical protein
MVLAFGFASSLLLQHLFESAQEKRGKNAATASETDKKNKQTVGLLRGVFFSQIYIIFFLFQPTTSHLIERGEGEGRILFFVRKWSLSVKLGACMAMEVPHPLFPVPFFPFPP